MTTTEPKPPCACGCGLTPAGKNAKFRPGHDRRMMGVLAHAARSGRGWASAPDEPPRDVMVVAAELFTPAGVAKLRAEIAKPPGKTAIRREPQRDSAAPESIPA